MAKNLCIRCETNHAYFHVMYVKNQLCRVCRDSILTYLAHLGVEMVDTNPFISELCVGSHALEDAWWHYYDSIEQRSRSIIRFSKFVRTDSQISVDKTLDILDDL